MFLRSLRNAGGVALNIRQGNISALSPWKRFSAAANLKSEEAPTTPEDALRNARPFSEIPGPGKLEFFRAVLPGGYLHEKSIYEMFDILCEKYGPFLRMPGMFGSKDMIVAMNPDDYPTIFRNEGKWPERRNFDTVLYHRHVHRKDFFEGTVGLTLSSGEQWGQLRSILNPILMQSKNVIPYLDTMLDITDEFLLRVREIRDPVTKEMPDTFVKDIMHLTLENVAAVALDTRLGIISKNRETSEANKIITSMRRLLELAFELDIKPSLWKIIKTPKFYEMMSSMDDILNISKKYVDEALARIENEAKTNGPESGSREKSVLEKVAQVNRKFAIITAMDMILGGTDTTTSTLTGILLAIAKNPDKQERLFEELKVVMPDKSSHISAENMRNLPYLRACIKEGMRIYPIAPGTMRRLPHDIVVSGYRVEQGTDITIAANLSMLNEKYVPQASKFLPERWLRTEKKEAGAISNPFMFVPFGFGPRSCVGKRIVDLELEVIIGRLVRNFNIEFNYSVENAFDAKFFNLPNIPLKFKFEERSD